MGQQFFLKRSSYAIFVTLLLLSQQLPAAPFTELLLFCRCVFFLEKLVTAFAYFLCRAFNII